MVPLSTHFKLMLPLSTMALLLFGSTTVKRATSTIPRHAAWGLAPRSSRVVGDAPYRIVHKHHLSYYHLGHQSSSRTANIINNGQDLQISSSGWGSVLRRLGDEPHHYIRRHQLSYLQQSSSANNEQSEEEEEVEAKKKSLTRKQRRRNTKAINLQRIDKVLAHRGIGSRKQTFELAKSKRITTAATSDAPHEERTRINSPKEKVPFHAPLFLNGRLLPGPPPLLLVYHKPKYMLSVMEDDRKYADQNRRHLGQVLKPRYKTAGLHPVGRLDYDTTGLILFSLDGTLTQRLLHPKHGIEKQYVATVQGDVNEAELSQRLAGGVTTTEGIHIAKLLEVTPSNGPVEDDSDELEDMIIHGDNIVNEKGEDGDDDDDDEGIEMEMIDDYSGPYSDVTLTVKEGKYRMVRRMLANCGHPVVELRRLRHGKIILGDLPVGEFREATEDELEWAKSLIS